MMIILKGHDTTSASMNWFLHLMGTNPDIQAKVQREVDDVLGEGTVLNKFVIRL